MENLKASFNLLFFKQMSIHSIVILLIITLTFSGCKEDYVNSNSESTKAIVVSYSSDQNSASNERIRENFAPQFVNLTQTGTLEKWLAFEFIGGNPPTSVMSANYQGIVGTGYNFADYFSADWNGDNMTDLICRNSNGSLYFFPWNYSNDTYPNASQGTNVGNSFLFANYLVADFTGDGITDLIGVDNSGNLYLYPFKYNTFIGNGGGAIVGYGYNFTHFFVADWNNDGSADLICRNASGSLLFFPFNKLTQKFPNATQGTNVGNGFQFTNYFVGEWTGDNQPDLVGRTSAGNLHLYPFMNNTFIGNGGGAIIASNYNYRDYFTKDFSGDGLSDMVMLDYSGVVSLSKFVNGSYSTIKVDGDIWNYSKNFQSILVN